MDAGGEDARRCTGGEAGAVEAAVGAFLQSEPADAAGEGRQVTHLVKQLKWLAGKWNTRRVVLHSFTHLGPEKAPPDLALRVIESTRERLESVGFEVHCTPFGWFLDLRLRAPGHPLARVYKEWSGGT